MPGVVIHKLETQEFEGSKQCGVSPINRQRCKVKLLER